jgi:hypothetical protein
MAVTYNSGEDRIYIDTGTYTWAQVKTADNTGGWNQIGELGTYQSHCEALVRVANGATTTLDLSENVIQFDQDIEVAQYGTLSIGRVSDTLPHSGSMVYLNGAEILPQATGTAAQKIINIWASKILILGTSDVDIGNTNNYTINVFKATIERDVLSTTLGSFIPGVDPSIEDLMVMRQQNGIHFEHQAANILNKVICHHCTNGIYHNYAGTIRIKRYRFAGNTYDAYLNASGAILHLYDLWSTFVVGKLYHANANNVTHLGNSINLTVQTTGETGIASALVSITGSDGVVQDSDITVSGGTHDEIYGRYEYYTGTSETKTDLTPLVLRVFRYGYKVHIEPTALGGAVTKTIALETDDYSVATEGTAAAYTGITLNHSLETITVSSNHTLQEIYDYCRTADDGTAIPYDGVLHTVNGVFYSCYYDFIINTGVTVTATDKVVICQGSATYTLNGTAQFTGIIGDQTDRRVPVNFSGVVTGSRYAVVRKSDKTTLVSGTAASASFTDYVTWTSDIPVNVRVRKSSAVVKYKPWEATTTLVNTGISVVVAQIEDEVVA